MVQKWVFGHKVLEVCSMFGSPQSAAENLTDLSKLRVLYGRQLEVVVVQWYPLFFEVPCLFSLPRCSPFW